ncbi:nucleotide exchange factor GrpE [Phycicoccus flavus]|uniref:nucleotide exchange factor GrpE n=1 Tax=Phycicoccus flavus TaxID=2502783 RepID=UPI000FEB609E|nr:nucleotide exchange factor GrpE [Phycicoccus flavus]NHA68861.1 nucleotide exchange factor GrpE [Phycicoccus flavus]
MTDESRDDPVDTGTADDQPVRAEEAAPEQSGAAPGPGSEGEGVTGGEAAGDGAAPPPAAEDDAVVEGEPDTGADTDAEVPDAGASADAVLAAERLADLQRLQAEYVNYKRRVDRDRAAVQERAVRDVLESLLGVLDDIHAAREHGDLEGGPFERIADKLEGTLGRYGLTRFGGKGEPFDPQQHEALMHAPWPADDDELPADASATTVVTVLQPGYRAGEQVLRPARVAVADPA